MELHLDGIEGDELEELLARSDELAAAHGAPGDQPGEGSGDRGVAQRALHDAKLRLGGEQAGFRQLEVGFGLVEPGLGGHLARAQIAHAPVRCLHH